jgi:transmembrane sensor
LFHVAKDPTKPFIVIAGNRKVIALGTSFIVRRENPQGSAYAVTLVEGRVAVESLAEPDVLPPLSASARASTEKLREAGHHDAPGAKPLTLLTRGERLRFQGDGAGVVDAPAIDRVTAWQRGELIFEDAALGEAAAEFNRFGAVQISFGDARVGLLRVGGVYRIGDAASFALAMAQTYRLNLTRQGQTITLSTANQISPAK